MICVIKISVVFTTGCHTATELYLDRQNSSLSKNPSHLRRKRELCCEQQFFINTRAVRYGQKIYITIFDFFFDFDFNHDFDTNRHALSYTSCFCTSYLSCTSCFALFFILLHILLFISFFYLYIYIYIYALVWCYFYIIFILCTVHWADLIWSTFHFWLYPV